MGAEVAALPKGLAGVDVGIGMEITDAEIAPGTVKEP